MAFELSQISFFLRLAFWGSILLIFYNYIGYGLILWGYLKLKSGSQKMTKNNAKTVEIFPQVTLIIAAFNEEDFIHEKINNSLSLDYPANKLSFLFITDGSTDKTPDIIARFPQITLLHEDRREGKINAIDRAMAYVKTPYVIFSDANTLLNKESVKNIMRHYSNKKVGGVAGEKKIFTRNENGAAAIGEGFYWKYESWLKKMDSDVYTVVGAAGELFSIRTDLYEYPGNNILLDDFVISLRICEKGYRVLYEPDAFATETPSSSIKEEKKRKVRISAGGFQSMFILRSLLNIFKHPLLSFQYISHRVLRWAVCPFLLPMVFILNIFIIVNPSYPSIYLFVFIAQVAFYISGLLGWLFYKKNIKIKLLYFPYYFIFMNICLYLGFLKFLKGKQSVLWDKAIRTKQDTPIIL